jgi:hypothetical protein
MTSQPAIFKRAQVRDPRGDVWSIVVEDRLDPRLRKLARDAAETFGRYAMVLIAPNGRHAEVLLDANVLQVDSELARYTTAIKDGAWTSELSALVTEADATT